MHIIRSIDEMQRWSANERNLGKTIGFVPTMGALHNGHSELFGRSVLEHDRTVVSIFVNALQFNNSADLEAYPRQIEDDIAIAEKKNVDALFVPSHDEMYPPNFSSTISAGDIAAHMEGLHRPGHFDGVATVVVKLLNAVTPDVAYFGIKDFQQVAVIRQVVRDLNIACQIVSVPTVREADGLALSSRNVRLTAEDRQEAVQIYRLLRELATLSLETPTSSADIKKAFITRLESSSNGIVEYVEVVDSRNLRPTITATIDSTICVAVWFGDVRLIDNISIYSSPS
jgi:pantoate--beta-alanine ligase